LILIITAALEGLGWRGYFLPGLLARQSALTASLLMGVLWGGLHIALTLPGMIYSVLRKASSLSSMMALPLDNSSG